ncbi:hypothetical protein VTI74DRAFT_6760 [Chaetomium olivicolor]
MASSCRLVMLPSLPFVVLVLIGLSVPPTKGLDAGNPFRPPCEDCVLEIVSKSSSTSSPKQSPSNASLALRDDSLLMGRSNLGGRWLLDSRGTCTPGWYPCSIGGKCCEIGYTCTANGGCCPNKSPEPCGENHCYNPSTMVCCPDGWHCDKGWDCVGDKSCCRSGHQPCGSNNCYDPKTHVCCPDGSGKSCPKEKPACVEGGCCPAGWEPCGETKCYDPKTQVCCTNSAGKEWACKADEKCCKAAGSCYDPKLQVCCEGGVCLEGEKCCDKECCLEGATCGADGFCTATLTRRTTILQTATAIATAIATTTTTIAMPAGPAGSSNGAFAPTMAPCPLVVAANLVAVVAMAG